MIELSLENESLGNYKGGGEPEVGILLALYLNLQH